MKKHIWIKKHRPSWYGTGTTNGSSLCLKHMPWYIEYYSRLQPDFVRDNPTHFTISFIHDKMKEETFYKDNYIRLRKQRV